jgi:hypothetical protein
MNEIGATDSRTNTKGPTFDVPAFLRVYQMRATNIMWFLGAGASRAAGIQTAGDMIWDFKQRLYRSHKKLPPSAITDPGDPIVRQKLQQYFDSLEGFPAEGANDEYSAYFEATYSSPKDRRAYLDDLIDRGKPSFGHLALALLMAQKLCRTIWTTNFDRTVEDAAAQILGGTGRLVVADLGEPAKLNTAVTEGRWPVYGKLHGDYHSEQIKNTANELRAQDEAMRDCLIQSCLGNGLAVVGYSGRDASVMEALTSALDGGKGFSGGLFWFKRGQDQPCQAVLDLIANARGLGIDAHIIDNESFDELLSDIVRFLPETSEKIQTIKGATRPRLASAPLKKSSTATPVIRTNALPLVSHPVMCRLVECSIGGWSEIHDAIKMAGVDIDAQRCRDGVVAFGRDADIRTAFANFDIKRFESRAIVPARLERETGELALLRDALFRAVGQRPGLRLERRRRTVFLIPDPSTVQPSVFNTSDVKSVDRISGVVENTAIRWTEACKLRLDYRLERLWLLLEPRVILDVPETATPVQADQAREFVRRRRTGRHNRLANAILDGWVNLVAGDEMTIRLRAFGISDGLDAEFEIARTTGFSGVAR